MINQNLKKKDYLQQKGKNNEEAIGMEVMYRILQFLL